MPREVKRDYPWHRHYWQGRLGLAVSVHDEISQVTETVGRLRPRLSRVLVARSGDDPLPDDLRRQVDHFDLLPDLSSSLSKWETPAASLARNFAALAQVAGAFPEVDWWAFATGDTVLLHEYGLERIVADCVGKDCVLGCARALKQDFHAAGLTLDDLQIGKGGGRKQTADLADFMPQLFLVAREALTAFAEIPVTNRWTSEQCLGDAFSAWAGQDWRKLRHVYSVAAGDFQDGVVWHAKYA